MNKLPDYYAILGVAHDAPPDVIKAAFKKLALQYHPDVYKGDDAHERMREILAAYQTLNDPQERRRYDMQRSEQGLPSSVSARGMATTLRSSTAKSSEVSPSARRDRQRYYDFPELRDGHGDHIDLISIAYTLSAEQARLLRTAGMLRGVLLVGEHNEYYCHRCHHHWSEGTSRDQMESNQLPRLCPHCHAGDWSEYLLLRCSHCRAVFESEQIRYEVGTYNYSKSAHTNAAALCPPYELFPLCPYCGQAHWCPAEEERVTTLRKLAARRAEIVRLALIGFAVVLVIVLGSLVASGLH